MLNCCLHSVSYCEQLSKHTIFRYTQIADEWVSQGSLRPVYKDYNGYLRDKMLA